MNIRYPIYEGVYRILTSQARQYLFNTNEIVHRTIRFLLALFPFCPPCGPHVKSNPAGRGKPSEGRDKKTKVKLKIQDV